MNGTSPIEPMNEREQVREWESKASTFIHDGNDRRRLSLLSSKPHPEQYTWWKLRELQRSRGKNIRENLMYKTPRAHKLIDRLSFLVQQKYWHHTKRKPDVHVNVVAAAAIDRRFHRNTYIFFSLFYLLFAEQMIDVSRSAMMLLPLRWIELSMSMTTDDDVVYRSRERKK